MITPSPPEQWTRLEKIQYLLDHWAVIFDPNTTSPYGAPGDGSGVPLLPQMSRHQSVLELAHVMRQLYTAAPGDYRHLKAYRCGVEWRVVWLPSRIKNPRGKWVVGDPRPERRRIIPAWLDMVRVNRAEAFLAERFQGEVFIPAELWDALVKPAITQEIAA